MLSYSEHQFKLAKPSEDGKSVREHLEQVEKQTGKSLEDLDGPPFPSGMVELWLSFLSISFGRTSGFNGPNPISYPDILAWLELTGNTLSPREVETLKMIDSVYIRIMTNDG